MNIKLHYENLKRIALQHRELTGNTISGLTGEIGEWETSKILNLRMTSEQNTPGYDAISKTSITYQIKTSVPSKRHNTWQFSHICINQNWDYVVFCFMTEKYEVICLVRMSKIQLKKAQTQSGKRHKSITGTIVIDIGFMVYVNKELYNEYMPKTKERLLIHKTSIDKGISKNRFIKQLLGNGIYNINMIIAELKENGYDISNMHSTRSMISHAKAALKRQL